MKRNEEEDLTLADFAFVFFIVLPILLLAWLKDRIYESAEIIRRNTL